MASDASTAEIGKAVATSDWGRRNQSFYWRLQGNMGWVSADSLIPE